MTVRPFTAPAPQRRVVLAWRNSFSRNALTDLVAEAMVERIDAIELVVRGDGHRYKLNLRTDRGFDGVNYQAAFEPPAGQWATLRLSLDVFQPSWRGRAVPDAPPLRGARIEQVGLMIADRQFGAFALAIGAIWAQRAGEGGEAEE